MLDFIWVKILEIVENITIVKALVYILIAIIALVGIKIADIVAKLIIIALVVLIIIQIFL